VLGLANIYNVRPSTLLYIEDEYTAFCFDEACGFIYAKMQNKEEPNFKSDEEEGEKEGKKHYSSFSELAKHIRK
jgi:hypothetical protein